MLESYEGNGLKEKMADLEGRQRILNSQRWTRKPVQVELELEERDQQDPEVNKERCIVFLLFPSLTHSLTSA